MWCPLMPCNSLSKIISSEKFRENDVSPSRGFLRRADDIERSADRIRMAPPFPAQRRLPGRGLFHDDRVRILFCWIGHVVGVHRARDLSAVLIDLDRKHQSRPRLAAAAIENSPNTSQPVTATLVQLRSHREHGVPRRSPAGSTRSPEMVRVPDVRLGHGLRFYAQ